MPDLTNPEAEAASLKNEGAPPTALIRTMRQDLERLRATKQPQAPILTPAAAQKIETHAARHERRARKNLYIISTAAFLALFITAAALFLQPKPPAKPPEVITPPLSVLTPPQPFFPVESARTVNVTALDRKSFFDALRDTRKETEREGTVKRLIIKVQDGGTERFLTPNDFFQFALLSPPPNFLANLDAPFMLFFTYDAGGGKTGFAATTKSPDRSFRTLLSWEPMLFLDLQPFLLPAATATPATPVFEDRTYRNIDWRYLKLSDAAASSIGYAVFTG